MIDYEFVEAFLMFMSQFYSEEGEEPKERELIDFSFTMGVGLRQLATVEMLLFTAQIITKCPKKIENHFVNLCPGNLTAAGWDLVDQLGNPQRKLMIL